MKNKIMNTINIVDGNIETTLDDNVKISSANAMTDIFQIKIDVLKDTDLKIDKPVYDIEFELIKTGAYTNASIVE